MYKRTAFILQEIFSSPEIASYLEKCSLKQWQIRDAIAYAPIPLERKRDMFLRLASGKDRRFFRRQASCVERAVRETRPKPGEFFYLKSCRYSDENCIEEGLEPYLAWEHIFERIRDYLGYLKPDEKELTWFWVEKWSPDWTGKLINEYAYTVFGTEVCYFSRNSGQTHIHYQHCSGSSRRYHQRAVRQAGGSAGHQHQDYLRKGLEALPIDSGAHLCGQKCR